MLHVESIPIPKLSLRAEQVSFIRLIERILKAKASNLNSRYVSEHEAEIDRLVYALYYLDEKEIAAVSGKRQILRQSNSK